MTDIRQLAQFGETHSRSSRAADEDPTVVDVKVRKTHGSTILTP
jgi:hypothetical protein